MKKHLIELMIEAGVKWPDGAKYAAQDKFNCRVEFYNSKGKPKHYNETSHYSDNNNSWLGSEFGVKLLSLCSNWDKTIVTREQYKKALIAHNLATNADAVEWHNPPSIEQLIAEYNRLQAISIIASNAASETAVAAARALAQVKEAGKALGLSVELLPTKQLEPTLNITDWRDLRVGDVVELIGSANRCWKQYAGLEMTVARVHPDQGDNGDQVDLSCESGGWSLGGNTTWRFICRPNKE